MAAAATKECYVRFEYPNHQPDTFVRLSGWKSNVHTLDVVPLPQEADNPLWLVARRVETMNVGAFISLPTDYFKQGFIAKIATENNGTVQTEDVGLKELEKQSFKTERFYTVQVLRNGNGKMVAKVKELLPAYKEAAIASRDIRHVATKVRERLPADQQATVSVMEVGGMITTAFFEYLNLDSNTLARWKNAQDAEEELKLCKARLTVVKKSLHSEQTESDRYKLEQRISALSTIITLRRYVHFLTQQFQ